MLMFCHSSAEAAAIPTLDLEGDSPITIHCGGNEEHWGSTWLAYKYYWQAYMEREGTSEGDRFLSIVTGLLTEEPIPSDSVPLRMPAA